MSHGVRRIFFFEKTTVSIMFVFFFFLSFIKGGNISAMVVRAGLSCL